MNPMSSKHIDVSAALAVLEAARVFFDFQEGDSLRLTAAAKRLSVSPDWMRDHLELFPNAWRLPAGERSVNGEGRNVGELRIPVADLLAFQERQRIRRVA